MGKGLDNLRIYGLAEDLVVKVYKVTKKFPKEERYGITSQLRRAIVSVAINIAEGYGRFHFKDRSMFLYNARGSLLEVKSLVKISLKLGFIEKKISNEVGREIDDLGIKINNFIKHLKISK